MGYPGICLALAVAFRPVAQQQYYLMDYKRQYIPQVIFPNFKHIRPV